MTPEIPCKICDLFESGSNSLLVEVKMWRNTQNLKAAWSSSQAIRALAMLGESCSSR